MGLLLSDVTTWLGTQAGMTGITIQGNRLQDTPDVVVMLGLANGGPPTHEGAFETWDIEVIARAEDDPAAETLANTVHGIFYANQSSFSMGGKWIRTIEIAAPPAYVEADVDRRAHWRARYRISAAA
jgi:hypothetical protein